MWTLFGASECNYQFLFQNLNALCFSLQPPLSAAVCHISIAKVTLVWSQQECKGMQLESAPEVHSRVANRVFVLQR